MAVEVRDSMLKGCPVAEPWRELYPFDSHYLALPEGRLHYVDEGSTASPQTIVCVHGNPTWSFYYRSIIAHFRDRYRCLAIDHLGCGLSDKPAGHAYCLANHTSNLVQWLDRLDLKKVVLVVHDWGGAIGLGAAVERPARVDKLLILNTAAFPPPSIPRRIALGHVPWVGSWAIRYANAFAWAATWMAIDRLPRLEPAVRQGLLYPYASVASRVAIDRFVQDIPRGPTHPTWSRLQRLESELPSLNRKPTRFVWGMKDWCFTPACLDRMLQAFPQARVDRLMDVGHYVMEEASPEVIANLTALLDEPAPGDGP
jgi:haloalkane dehalogenase